VLANDTDVDGQVLTVVQYGWPSRGEVVLYADGSFTYTPTNDFTGTDSFRYRVLDGLAISAPVLVTITMNGTNALPVPIRLTVSGAARPVMISYLGVTGQPYLIQASANLTSWQTIQTITALADGPNEWADADAPNYPARFYRVLGSQP